MPSDLSRLACGAPNANSELGQVLTHIGSIIDTLAIEIAAFSDRSDQHVTMYGPFLGRSVLEQSFTALIARFDPFRVLLIREMQRSPDYEAGTRLKSAIQWQGDILSEKVGDIWSPNKPSEKITRALLGDYFDHLIWRPAMAAFKDSLDPPPPGPWTQQLQLLDLDAVVPRIRQEVESTYSSLSKGIHHEFVIPPETRYERKEVVTYIRDAIRLSSHLGLLSQMIPYCPFAITREETFSSYNNLQKWEVQ